MEQKYISLSEAAKLTDYSQDYISLLCRQEKLKGIKIGRNWVTTKKWLEEYTEKAKEKNIIGIKTKKSKNIKVIKNKIISKRKSYLLTKHDSLSAYESQSKFSYFVKFVAVMSLAIVFGINFLFFQSWFSSSDKGFASLKTNQNGVVNTITEKTILIERDYQGRVAGAKDDDEFYQTENKIQIETEIKTENETSSLDQTEIEEYESSLYVIQ